MPNDHKPVFIVAVALVGLFALVGWVFISFGQPLPWIDIMTLAVISSGVIIFYIRRLSRNLTTGDEPHEYSADTPLLLTLFSLGVTMHRVAEGKVDGLHYKLFLTAQNPTLLLPEGTLRSPGGQTFMLVELPHRSQVHFAGFSLRDEEFKPLLGNTNLDNLLGRVDLEGDFPDHFRLYCNKGFEHEMLQVLDPDKMAFLVDFAHAYNWELVGNSLYFVQSTGVKSESEQTIVGAANEFAKKILPTLERMSHRGR